VVIAGLSKEGWVLQFFKRSTAVVSISSSSEAVKEGVSGAIAAEEAMPKQRGSRRRRRFILEFMVKDNYCTIGFDVWVGLRRREWHEVRL
jgi:hypothetical protein